MGLSSQNELEISDYQILAPKCYSNKTGAEEKPAPTNIALFNIVQGRWGSIKTNCWKFVKAFWHNVDNKMA